MPRNHGGFLLVWSRSALNEGRLDT